MALPRRWLLTVSAINPRSRMSNMTFRTPRCSSFQRSNPPRNPMTRTVPGGAGCGMVKSDRRCAHAGEAKSISGNQAAKLRLSSAMFAISIINCR